MSRARSIWLVARRELFERGRSRGFIFSVLFTTVIIIGSFVVPALIIGDEGRPGRRRRARARAARDGDHDGRRARPGDRDRHLPDRAPASPRSRDEQVAALVIVPADLSNAGELVFHEEADPTIQGVVSSAIAGSA